MWRNQLVRELAIILAIKLLALYLIWLGFFSTPAAPPGELEMERMLLNPGSVSSQQSTY
ncbi:MAG TPA: hypothetical protein VGE00_11080 [Gammaproteobacteria bacterium]